ncbi:exopolyphosphatase [Mobiluncus sp.]|uniref:exopolyphosphatase n=1 Tax=Mobiluncus sp. TaxID=47293 RepID=UPI002A916DF9|nr:exopolyphosphatase [Mobiluncus sp.]MDY6076330.1 exopolyphosphatase [Mobiluncus sp.]
MATMLAMRDLGMRNLYIPGMAQRAAIRSFAKENGILTDENKKALDALDRFEMDQARIRALAKQNKAKSKSLGALGGTVTSIGFASDSAQAKRLARSYEADAVAYSMQARAAVDMGDEEAARSYEAKARQAVSDANKMYAKAAELGRQEAEKRKEIIEREGRERIEQRKAMEKAREAAAEAKRKRLEIAQKKVSEGWTHLNEAEKAAQKRKKAEAEMWAKRIEESQFWIYQMHLVQMGEHPDQAIAQAQIQAFRDASTSVTEVAPDYTPTSAPAEPVAA